jgi:hypothetical protein
MKYTSAAVIGPALLLLLICTGCSREPYSHAQAEKNFSKCLEQDVYGALADFRLAFNDFLDDNGYIGEGEYLVDGYRNYLRHVLQLSGPDTAWIFRREALEEILQRFESLHIDALLYEGSIQSCAVRIRYPDDMLMASYRQIMPQHTVSPRKFAEEFVAKVRPDELDDHVLQIMVALEYFLGAVLGELRPDEEHRHCC